MAISQIKIIDGVYNSAGPSCKLIVEVISGMPAPGDGVIMQDCIFSIKQIQKTSTGEQYNIIAKSDTLVLNNYHDFVKQLKGTVLICGFDVDNYKLLPSTQKLDYLKTVASIYPVKRVSKFITEHLQLCLALFPYGKTVTGLSKFGGLPHAPVHFSFPKDKNGRSALFIGQIHIDEFNRSYECTKALNGTGILYFFGTINSEHETYHSFGDIMVRYCETVNDLVEVPLPDDLAAYGVFEESNIFAVEEISIPNYASTYIDEAGLNEDEVNFYEFFSELIENYNYFQPPTESYFEKISLLGYPSQVQGCVLVEAVFKSLKQGWYEPDENQRKETPEMIKAAQAAALQWRHLFSLPTDPFRKLSNFPGEFNEYMDGNFNLMIKHVDLEKMNFENTECVYQST